MARIWTTIVTLLVAIVLVINVPVARAGPQQLIENIEAGMNVMLRRLGLPEVVWVNTHSEAEASTWTSTSDDQSMIPTYPEAEAWAIEKPLEALLSVGLKAVLSVQLRTNDAQYDIRSFRAEKQRYCYAGAFTRDFLSAHSLDHTQVFIIVGDKNRTRDQSSILNLEYAGGRLLGVMSCAERLSYDAHEMK